LAIANLQLLLGGLKYLSQVVKSFVVTLFFLISPQEFHFFLKNKECLKICESFLNVQEKCWCKHPQCKIFRSNLHVVEKIMQSTSLWQLSAISSWKAFCDRPFCPLLLNKISGLSMRRGTEIDFLLKRFADRFDCVAFV